MNPGRRAYLLKKHSLYFVISLRSLTSRTNIQICRPQKPEQHNDERSVNHQPATKCYSIPFSCWWNYNLILTIICPASHYSDVHVVNFDSQSLQRTPCVIEDPPFPVDPSSTSRYLPTSKPYLQLVKPRQGNAHTSLSWIVGYRGWLWWATMGFYLDIGSVTQFP